MRIILDGIPAMLREMIKETITADARLSIVAETIGESGLRTTLAQAPADVVIVVSNSDVAEADRYIELLRAYPDLRVVTIASDGRRAFIYEAWAGRSADSELSPGDPSGGAPILRTAHEISRLRVPLTRRRFASSKRLAPRQIASACDAAAPHVINPPLRRKT